MLGLFEWIQLTKTEYKYLLRKQNPHKTIDKKKTLTTITKENQEHVYTKSSQQEVLRI